MMVKFRGEIHFTRHTRIARSFHRCCGGGGGVVGDVAVLNYPRRSFRSLQDHPSPSVTKERSLCDPTVKQRYVQDLGSATKQAHVTVPHFTLPRGTPLTWGDLRRSCVASATAAERSSLDRLSMAAVNIISASFRTWRGGWGFSSKVSRHVFNQDVSGSVHKSVNWCVSHDVSKMGSEQRSTPTQGVVCVSSVKARDEREYNTVMSTDSATGNRASGSTAVFYLLDRT